MRCGRFENASVCLIDQSLLCLPATSALLGVCQEAADSRDLPDDTEIKDDIGVGTLSAEKRQSNASVTKSFRRNSIMTQTDGVETLARSSHEDGSHTRLGNLPWFQ